MSNSDFVIERATQAQASLAQAVPKDRAVALVGFPDHADCGEHAVWLGATRMLKRLFAGPAGGVAYQCSRDSYSSEEMRSKIGEAPILMPGGNWLGRATAEFRLRVVKDFPENKVVILPQLVSPSEGETLQRWVRSAAHPDLTFFAGGSDSETLMARHLGSAARVARAPDPAFLLGSQQRAAKPQFDIVWVARTDEERNDEETEAAARLSSQAAEKFELPRFPDGVEINLVVRQRPPTILLTDWHSLIFENEQARLGIRRLEFDARSDVYLARALHLLSLGHVVITDRAHAHLLCLLLEVPHVLIDTASGKNGDFHRTWTKDSPLCRLARNPAEAWVLARNAAAKIKGAAEMSSWSWDQL